MDLCSPVQRNKLYSFMCVGVLIISLAHVPCSLFFFVLLQSSKDFHPLGLTCTTPTTFITATTYFTNPPTLTVLLTTTTTIITVAFLCTFYTCISCRCAFLFLFLYIRVCSLSTDIHSHTHLCLCVYPLCRQSAQ